ncbi:hypothetical protein BKA70DRAFT_1226298 [Coprinopsis sp. MPI-PUGE-AT-0042]|nr:hypothetical protein BKA70DRAFT_1226298 [Coprinopsis sp. MPI-PUGE-AT-0042]
MGLPELAEVIPSTSNSEEPKEKHKLPVMEMLIDKLAMDKLHLRSALRSMAPHRRDACSLHNKEDHEGLYPTGAIGFDSYVGKKRDRTRISIFTSCLSPSISTPSLGDSNLDVNASQAMGHCSISATVTDQAGLSLLSSIWWPTLPVTKLEDSASGGASSSYSASNPDRDTKLGQATSAIPLQALWQTELLKRVRFLQLQDRPQSQSLALPGGQLTNGSHYSSLH